MSSVKLFPGSKNWYACYKIPTTKLNSKGKPVFLRRQRSTGTPDESKAEQLAISYERAAGLVALKQWTEHSAHNFLREIQAISGVRVAQIEQVKPFFENWLEKRKRLTAESTQLNERSIVDDFYAFLGEERTAGPLINITPHLVAGFRDDELKRGKSPSTINKALSVLAQACEEAVTQLSLEKNPARGHRIKGAKKRVQVRSPFSLEQFRRLVKRTGPKEKSIRGRKVSPDWPIAIVVGGYTGARQQEVMQLKWAQVDFAKGSISIRRAKNGDLHTSPLHPCLRKVLMKMPGRKSPGSFVMPYLASLPERSISKMFRETILPRAGISQPYAMKSEQKGVGRKIAPYSYHSLRHALSTWLAQAGVDESIRMKIVGHEDEEVSRTYTHIELLQLQTEIAKVPSL